MECNKGYLSKVVGMSSHLAQINFTLHTVVSGTKETSTTPANESSETVNSSLFQANTRERIIKHDDATCSYKHFSDSLPGDQRQSTVCLSSTMKTANKKTQLKLKEH